MTTGKNPQNHPVDPPPKKGVIKKIGSAVRFSTITIPKKLLGVDLMKSNYDLIANQYKLMALPSCPQCNEAKMVLDMDREGIREHYENGTSLDLYHWKCPACQNETMLPIEPSLAKEVAQGKRNEVVSHQVHEIDDTELNSYAKLHKIYSRIFYCLALLTFLILLYNIAFKSSGFLSYIPFACISIACATQGLIRAYRHWQVVNRHLFVENGFQNWIKQGKWFV